MDKDKKSTSSPAQRRLVLERQVDAAHDWLEGQTYSGGGTSLSSTDRCRICGLERRWESDSQNGVPSHYLYARGSLISVARHGCQ